MIISLDHANLIELLHVEALPLEERIALVEETTNLVEARTIARIGEALSPADQTALVNLIEAEDDEAVEMLLTHRSIDIFAIAREETDRVKCELLGLIEEPEQRSITFAISDK